MTVRWALLLTATDRWVAAPRRPRRLNHTEYEGRGRGLGRTQAAAVCALSRPPRRAPNSKGSERWSSRSQYGQVSVPGP
jgi:hypothetical protein